MISTDSNLGFNSDFEGGNLDIAMKQGRNEYDLFMRTDSNTRGHHQWFYFSVKNKEIGTYKFNVLNFTKSDSLYQQGMRIAVFSIKKSILAKDGKLSAIFSDWHNAGDNINYDVSKLYSENASKSKLLYYRLIAGSQTKVFYSLSFEYTFEYANDLTYFAYSIPYKYSDLLNLLSELKNNCKDNSEILLRDRKSVV